MTIKEFKTEVEKNTNLKIYSILKLRSRNGVSGYKVIFCLKLNCNTVSTEREEHFWYCNNREDVATVIYTNYAKRPSY